METSRSKMDGFSRVEAQSPHPSEDTVTSGLVLIDGHHLYWEGHGPVEAPPIILMHHGLGSVRSWHRQIPALTQSGFRVMAFDRWGYGRSDIRPTFEENFLLHDAEATIRLLDELGIPRAHFIGHSDGGTIALIIASDHPERVLVLVVVAAHVYYEPKMALGLKTIQDSSRVPPLQKVLQREHGDRANSLVDAWVNHWSKSDVELLSIMDRLEAIQALTLVIQGEGDEHASPKHAEDIADRIENSELWLIPGVGHMPTHEIPDQFNERVGAFLGSIAH